MGHGPAPRVAAAQAGDGGQVVGVTVAERGEQAGERDLALAAHDEVDVVEVAVQRGALRAVAVRAAEDGGGAGCQFLDHAGRGQGRRVLRERGGEADHVRRGRGDLGGGLPHEQRCEFVQFPRLGQHVLRHLLAEVFRELRDPPTGLVVERAGEDPLAVSGEVRGRAELVLLESVFRTGGHPVGEVEVGVHHFDVRGAVGEDVEDAAFEDAEGQGRRIQRRPRHVHQHDVHGASSSRHHSPRRASARRAVSRRSDGPSSKASATRPDTTP